jgi:hypothetical protein
MPNPLDDRSAAQRGQREAGEITAEDETGHGRLETLDRHRKEIEVLKKPLASWTPLVAMISVPICARIDPLDPIGPPLSRPIRGFTPAEPIHAIRIRLPVEAVQGLSTGRRTRQILSVSSVAPVSSWSRQQAEKRIRVAAGALFENRADNKLARMSVVMLHVKTVALISSPCLNGAIAPQHTVVVLKCALNIEEFDHY